MRLREPAAVVVLVALGLQLVARPGARACSSGAPIDVTGFRLAYYLADPALLVLLTALVDRLLGRPSRRRTPAG